MDELNNSLLRRQRLKSTRSEDSSTEPERPEKVSEPSKSINYDNIEELEHEISEITKKTSKLDPSSPFAIAMSAKHRTLTKRYLTPTLSEDTREFILVRVILE